MVAVNYDWDELEDNIDEEYDDGGLAVAEYTTEPGQFGNLISQRRGDESRMFHFDGLGSTLVLTNTAGTVMDSYAYSAFGLLAEEGGNTINEYRYLGQRGARWVQVLQTLQLARVAYSPSLARSLSTLNAANATGRYSITSLVGLMIFAAAEAESDERESMLCSQVETMCIRDALRLATSTIREKADACFNPLRRCPSGAASTCTPEAIGECLRAVLARTSYSCADRGVGGCHRGRNMLVRNSAHTDSLCAVVKGAGARGVQLPGFSCDPCSFPLPYANDCRACPDGILFFTVTYLCRDIAPDRRSIGSYCNSGNPTDLHRLAVLLVHEAAHSCVGGHDTTGKQRAGDDPSCDKCNRNDSFDIDAGFNQCLA